MPLALLVLLLAATFLGLDLPVDLRPLILTFLEGFTRFEGPSGGDVFGEVACVSGFSLGAAQLCPFTALSPFTGVAGVR